MLKQGIFREYDIRGIADVELQDSGVEVLGRALGTYLIRHSGHTIALGRDCRLSGERLRAEPPTGALQGVRQSIPPQQNQLEQYLQR